MLITAGLKGALKGVQPFYFITLFFWWPARSTKSKRPARIIFQLLNKSVASAR